MEKYEVLHKKAGYFSKLRGVLMDGIRSDLNTPKEKTILEELRGRVDDLKTEIIIDQCTAIIALAKESAKEQAEREYATE